MLKGIIFGLTLVSALVLTACNQPMTRQQQGALVGGALGAGVGAAVGRVPGAIIGGAGGALVGSAVAGRR